MTVTKWIIGSVLTLLLYIGPSGLIAFADTVKPAKAVEAKTPAATTETKVATPPVSTSPASTSAPVHASKEFDTTYKHFLIEGFLLTALRNSTGAIQTPVSINDLEVLWEADRGTLNRWFIENKVNPSTWSYKDLTWTPPASTPTPAAPAPAPKPEDKK